MKTKNLAFYMYTDVHMSLFYYKWNTYAPYPVEELLTNIHYCGSENKFKLKKNCAKDKRK